MTVLALLVSPVRAQQTTASEILTQRLQRLQTQVETRPNDTGLVLQYADALYEAQRFEEAAQYYGQYLETGQAAPTIVQRYLITLAATPGTLELGEQAAQRFLNQYPDSDDLHMRLGYFQLWQGKRGPARASFARALSLNPANTEARQGLTQADEQPGPGRIASAINQLMEAVDANPGAVDQRLELVETLLEQNRPAQAFEYLRPLADRYEYAAQWDSLFTRIDVRLSAEPSTADLYLVERLEHRLNRQPLDAGIRYRLVDALTAAGRTVEAYTLLIEAPYVEPEDTRFRTRIQALIDADTPVTSERLAQLEALVERAPRNLDARQRLLDAYLATQRWSQAFEMFESLLEQMPRNEPLRYRYARTLYQANRYPEAMRQAQLLLSRMPDRETYKQLYVLSSVSGGIERDQATRYTEELLTESPNDAQFMLDLADAYLQREQVDQASTYLQRARDTGRAPQRVETLQIYLDRLAIETEQAQRYETLREARILRREGHLDSALVVYETYMAHRETPTRDEWLELADMYRAAQSYVAARTILDEVQQRSYSYDTEKEIAKLYLDEQDFAAAGAFLEPLVEQRPDDYEARVLLCDAYREARRLGEAEDVCKSLLAVSSTSRIGLTRQTLLRQADPGLRLLHIEPMTHFVRGEGNGTRYQRWTRGAVAQLFLPIPVALQAGYAQMRIEGSRRLVPDARQVTEQLTQMFVGGHIDFTPALQAAAIPYTNRLSFRAGVYDFDSGRRAGFGFLRYDRQVPDRYTASVGVTNDEGAVALWSPAGGTFNLRLTQIDVGVHTLAILPDSALWVRGRAAVNIVDDTFGSAVLESFSNYGVDIDLEVGYQVLSDLYLGLAYDRLAYRTSVDVYYAPGLYESYLAWLGYEWSNTDRLRFHLRGALGVSARTRGTVARELESSLTYRPFRRLSVGLTLGAAQSYRPFVGTASRIDGPYTTFSTQGVVYWTF